MKSVLLSVRPEWVAKILNGEKTIEVRKKFPKDYVGWVYIYVTKNHKHASWEKRDTLKRDSHDGKSTNHFQLWTDDMVEDNDKLNGKVVARFWCDKVDEFYDFDDDLCEQACLDRGEMLDYLVNKNGYAIHITKLEIFDKPKEISEFGRIVLEPRFFNGGEYYEEDKQYLTRAPQSFMFIEV